MFWQGYGIYIGEYEESKNMNKTYMREISKALAEKHAVLMIGAGFSKNAEKISVVDKYFMNWNELSDLFYKQLYGDSQSPGKAYNSSLRLAQEVEIMFGRPKLEKIIKEAVPDLDYAPSILYIKLMELPWRDVFTTNYDTLLERAADKVSTRRYNVVHCQEDLVNSNQYPRIVKLHGSFPSHRPFIITEEDYRTYPVRFAAMVNTVQQAMLENVFCMLGFSCEDPNFIKWIGWIHDNLGKSRSQMIYMVSVTHIPESKRKLLFERNIIVLDLEDLWPEKSIEERVGNFLKELNSDVEGNQKKSNWFDYQKLDVNTRSKITKKTACMKQLNDSYPGWIFLPWKMKSKVDYALKQFSNMDDLESLPYEEQLNYIYEFVRFMDIAGRPLLFQYIERFWKIVNTEAEEPTEKQKKSQCFFKKQETYLHLLRAFREQAQWKLYDECYEKIEKEKLDYDRRQFLYACDCWKYLFRFEAKELTSMLENWKLLSGDAYWALIKANMYAFIGETTKAERLLTGALIQVRKQLIKENDNEYLVSIEESIVSLINYIRQGNWKISSDDLECCLNDNVLSWWNENDKYCYHLNEINEPKERFEENDNFDLSTTFTMNFGENNQNIFYALEYWRFLELTGHPFRVNSVSNTKGLFSSLRYLANYYSHWSLMQILIARDSKHVDILFGRASLAELTQKNADAITTDYLTFWNTVSQNIKSKNSFWSRSIYDQSAAILPIILSRLCYKCSESMLDQLYNKAVELCLSDASIMFKEVGNLFRGIFSAYSVEKQNEKLEKLLQLPMGRDQTTGYYDPVFLVDIPNEKQNFDLKIYNRTMYQIRQRVEDPDKNSEAAINRLRSLDKLIVLNDEDRNYLCRIIENSQDIYDKWWLYRFDPQKYSEKKNEVYEDTLKKIEKESNPKEFVGNQHHYEYLIDVIKELSIQTIDIERVFRLLKDLVTASRKWNNFGYYVVKLRISQSFIIALECLFLQDKSGSELFQTEYEAITDYFAELKDDYSHPAAIDMVEAVFVRKEKSVLDDFQQELWLCDENDLELFIDFYNDVYQRQFNIRDNITLSKYSEILFSVIVYRTISNELYQSRAVWRLCELLIAVQIPLDWKLTPLLNSLTKCQEKTQIQKTDTEKQAIYKLQCRMIGCRIARELYRRNIQANIIGTWKLVSECKDEFTEIRNIRFDENS